MSDWTAGYVADIGYTFGYYTELNPLRVELAFLHAGLALPQTGTACELGFGQGMSANIHAAASITEWHGTDFNPSQAAFAQELVTASGATAHLHDDTFADFCTRPELPDFDYIGLHGIWSWISDANRSVIVDFIRRKLKVGGVLYISYNTQPGWAAFAPMRNLLAQHASSMGVDGLGITYKIERALDFADQLLATNPTYVKANPLMAERTQKLREQERSYLAHEYFNRDWHPMYFASMVEWFAPAKLSYACSANLLDHVDVLNLTTEQQALLDQLPDPVFRESVRDFMVNQQFRKDYWVKGPRKLSALEQAESLRKKKVLLRTHRPDVSLTVKGALGEANMSEAIYAPLLDLLADHKARSLGQIEQCLVGRVGFVQLLQVIMVLTGAGHVVPVQDEHLIPKAKKHTDKLNAHLINKARSGGEISYLASPVTGGGVPVGRFPQLFLLALAQGKKQPLDMAKMVWEVLASQGQKLVKGSVTLNTAEENVEELKVQAQTFLEKQLPILKALQIA